MVEQSLQAEEIPMKFHIFLWKAFLIRNNLVYYFKYADLSEFQIADSILEQDKNYDINIHKYTR